MLTDPIISVAGHAVTVFQLLTIGALLLSAGAVLLAFRRELRLSVRRSAASDQMYDQLLRIANALDRLADQASDAAIAKASRRMERTSADTAKTPTRENRHTAYSMFGR
jgi:hypothetical protein